MHIKQISSLLLLPILLIAGLAIISACQKKKPEQVPPPPPPSVEKPGPWKPETQQKPELQVDNSAAAFNKQGVLKMIHFDTNKSNIRLEDRAILKANAEWLLAHDHFEVTIEGHCDERNTRAYNLALGERRANAAKQYLIGLGVPASSIHTVSYGKARPLCTEHNESCWSRNRRDAFVIRDKD